jgi:hypothetical protein
MVGPPSVVMYSTVTPCLSKKPFSAATYTGVNDGSTPVAIRTTGFMPPPSDAAGVHAAITSPNATAARENRFMRRPPRP